MPTKRDLASDDYGLHAMLAVGYSDTDKVRLQTT